MAVYKNSCTFLLCLQQSEWNAVWSSSTSCSNACLHQDAFFSVGLSPPYSDICWICNTCWMQKNDDQRQYSVGQQFQSAKSLIPVNLFSLQDNKELDSLLFPDICFIGLIWKIAKCNAYACFVAQSQLASKRSSQNRSR